MPKPKAPAAKKKKAAPKPPPPRKKPEPEPESEEGQDIAEVVGVLTRLTGGWNDTAAERRFGVIPEGTWPTVMTGLEADEEDAYLRLIMTMQITDRQGNDREREFSKFYSWEDSDGKDVSADNLAELKMDFEVLGSELPDSVESPEEAAQAIVDEIMRFIREEIPFNVSVNNRTRRNRKTGKMETRSFTTIEGLISE